MLLLKKYLDIVTQFVLKETNMCPFTSIILFHLKALLMFLFVMIQPIRIQWIWPLGRLGGSWPPGPGARLDILGSRATIGVFRWFIAAATKGVDASGRLEQVSVVFIRPFGVLLVKNEIMLDTEARWVVSLSEYCVSGMLLDLMKHVSCHLRRREFLLKFKSVKTFAKFFYLWICVPQRPQFGCPDFVLELAHFPHVEENQHVFVSFWAPSVLTFTWQKYFYATWCF